MVTTDIAILTPKPLASSSGLDGTDHHIDWHPRPDWVALSSDRLALESGTITTTGTDLSRLSTLTAIWEQKR